MYPPGGLPRQRPVRPNTIKQRISILLADDDAEFCEAIREWVEKEPGFVVVGEARDGRQAVALAATHAPDVILMDVAMPVCSGVDATRKILKDRPETRIIALSFNGEKQFRRAMRDAGASAYVNKADVAEQLLPLIRAAVGLSQN